MRARVLKLLARPRVPAASQAVARRISTPLLRSSMSSPSCWSVAKPRALLAPAARQFASEADVLDENRFMELADDTLHGILNWLDGVDEMLEESDISLAVRLLAC